MEMQCLSRQLKKYFISFFRFGEIQSVVYLEGKKDED
jgi:hypothetical protein